MPRLASWLDQSKCTAVRTREKEKESGEEQSLFELPLLLPGMSVPMLGVSEGDSAGVGLVDRKENESVGTLLPQEGRGEEEQEQRDVGGDPSVASEERQQEEQEESSSTETEREGLSSPKDANTVERKAGQSPNIIELRRKAKAYIQSEAFEEALPLLNQCIELRPSANLFRLRCLCYSRLGMHDLSLQDAHSIEKLKPKSCTSYFHMGSALYATGDYANAAKSFQQVSQQTVQKGTNYYYFFFLGVSQRISHLE